MTVTQVWSFLGFCNYYWTFIKHYAQVAKPLYQLVSGDNVKAKRKEVEWSKECKEAFLKLKEICSNTPILAYADYQRPFKVHTDASESGLGAVLYQDQEDGTTRVVAYASRSLSNLKRDTIPPSWSSWLSNGLFVKDFMSICMGESLKYTRTITPSPMC